MARYFAPFSRWIGSTTQDHDAHIHRLPLFHTLAFKDIANGFLARWHWLLVVEDLDLLSRNNTGATELALY